MWSGVCEEGERGLVRSRWEGQGAHRGPVHSCHFIVCVCTRVARVGGRCAVVWLASEWHRVVCAHDRGPVHSCHFIVCVQGVCTRVARVRGRCAVVCLASEWYSVCCTWHSRWSTLHA